MNLTLPIIFGLCISGAACLFFVYELVTHFPPTSKKTYTDWGLWFLCVMLMLPNAALFAYWCMRVTH